MLFQAVMDAVSPFRRAETKTSGVEVFDMSIPVNAEVYRHVEGCACEILGDGRGGRISLWM